MLPLALPGIAARDSYTAAISRVRDSQFALRLEGIKETVCDAAIQYEAAAAAQSLDTILRHDSVADVTGQELESLYTSRMAKMKSAARPIYDQLLAGAPNGRCPICAHRNASTLDHHLPKTHYPIFSVIPANLVPACKDCNWQKRAGFPTAPREVTLHPYFDNVDEFNWLQAELIETSPAVVRFFVEAPNGIDALLAARLERHFDLFRLGRLYSAQAAVELINIRYRLSQLLDSSGPQVVHSHLQEEATSRRAARPNSWQTATYDAWAGSDWFCEGGFQS